MPNAHTRNPLKYERITTGLPELYHCNIRKNPVSLFAQPFYFPGYNTCTHSHNNSKCAG